MKTRHAGIPSCETRDGSLIRELMHPTQHGHRAQSLAEAIVPPGRDCIGTPVPKRCITYFPAAA